MKMSSTNPEPIIDLLDVAMPDFPVDALGGLAAPAQAISEHVQVPNGMAGMAVLTAAALVAQAHIDVEIDGRRFPCSLFGMTIAASGDRKSQTDNLAMREHRLWEEQAAAEWKRATELQTLVRDVWDTQVKRLKAKGGDPMTIMEALKALGPRPTLSPEPTLTVTSPTFEGLVQAYRHGIPSKGLFSDEGGSFFGGYSMRQEGVKATIAGLSKLWDGSPIQKTNAAEGQAFSLWGRRLSAHLMLQPVLADEVMRNPLLNEQGFLPRFIFTCPRSLKGSRLYRGSDPTQDGRMTGYWALMRERLNMPVATGENGELALRTLKLDDDARHAWIDAYNGIERELGAHKELTEVGAFGSKSAEVAARIAAVLAFIENPSATRIGAQHVRGGIAIVWHSLETLLAIRNLAQVDAELLEVEKLRCWLIERMRDRSDPVITKTEVLWRYRPKVGGKLLGQRLNMLAAKGWLKMVPGGAQFGGKLVRQAWRVQLTD